MEQLRIAVGPELVRIELSGDGQAFRDTLFGLVPHARVTTGNRLGRAFWQLENWGDRVLELKEQGSGTYRLRLRDAAVLDVPQLVDALREHYAVHLDERPPRDPTGRLRQWTRRLGINAPRGRWGK